MVRACSFTSPVADLKRHQRTPDGILEALRKNPRVSTFDLSEYAWLRNGVKDLEHRGMVSVDEKEPYPWVRFVLHDPPLAPPPNYTVFDRKGTPYVVDGRTGRVIGPASR
jgi:hypothetical protein